MYGINKHSVNRNKNNRGSSSNEMKPNKNSTQDIPVKKVTIK